MRTIALLILALTASSVMSACEGPNFISRAAFFTVAASGGETSLSADTDVCGFQSGDDICCDADTVNSFQDKAEAYIEALEELAGERDQYFLDRRGDVLEVRENLNRIANALERALDGDAADALVIAALAGSFADYVEALTTNFATLKSNFTAYQESRVGCMEALVDIQASAWCLACEFTLDANQYVDLTNDAITFSGALNTRLSGSCFNYIQYSAGQSVIITLFAAKDALGALGTALEKYLNDDIAGATRDLTTAGTALARASIPSDPNEKPVRVPASCVRADCDWILDSVFPNAALQNQTIVQGGTVITSLPSFGNITGVRRALEGVEGGRRLQNGWGPAAGASGVSISFSGNPGGVDNDQNSAIRNGVVACAVAALALLF